MNRSYGTRVVRLGQSALIALPMTVALIFLMTRLISPPEPHSVVTRMIQNIELQRALPRPNLVSAAVPKILVLAKRPTGAPGRMPPIAPVATAETTLVVVPASEHTVGSTDWWAAIGKVAKAAEDIAAKRWLLEQGHERYASIMQGPLPILNSVRAKLPETQEDRTGYLNTYGDKEYAIGENCIFAK